MIVDKEVLNEEQTALYKFHVSEAIYSVGFLARFLPNYNERVSDEIKIMKIVKEEIISYDEVVAGFKKVSDDIVDLRHMIKFDSDRTKKIENTLKLLSEQQLKLTQFITKKK